MKRMSLTRNLVLSAIAAMAAAAADAQVSSPIVTIASGVVRGVPTGDTIAWKGIPFAAPPVAALRWRAPQPVAAWRGERAADAYGHDCMQLPFPSDAAPLGTPPAEDCLYANVWRPVAGGRRLPVLFWIYGGGFVNGGSSPPTYSGAALARKGVIVVSFNYRVGRFGVFAHPQLTRAKADGDRLVNYGYMDQLAALGWTRANIAAFGGDPDNITVIGESAGGMSVHMLLTSPLTRGAFRRAIIMSGADGGSMATTNMDAAEKAGVAFAASKGIAADDPDALAKLRALPADAVVDGLNMASSATAAGKTYVGPFPDGVVAVDARAAYRTGAFARVPVMVGATSADMGGPTGRMIVGARTVASELSGKGVPVYAYRFSYVASSVGGTGARHATDIPFFFDTADIKYGAGTTPRDRRIADIISDYVVNFAKTGDPNGRGLPSWPRFGTGEKTLLDFTADGTAVAGADPLASAPPPSPVR